MSLYLLIFGKHILLRCYIIFLITARVRSSREGTVFTGVCLFTSTEVPRPADRGATPFPGLDEGGVPHPADGGYPLPMFGWGYPIQLTGVPHPADGEYPPPPGPAQRVLATRQAVCLLRSRSRTFLLIQVWSPSAIHLIQTEVYDRKHTQDKPGNQQML